MVRTQIQQMIRNRRSSAVLHHAANLCEKFLRAYYNEDFYRRDQNGEDRVVRLFLEHCGTPDPVILDVGAHHGHWALSVAAQNPRAQIFCFEIVSEVRALLRSRTADCPNVHVLDYGLSSTSGYVDVTHNEGHDTTSAIRPRLNSMFFSNGKTRVLAERVERGDDVLPRLRVSRLDFLKIDVEGHEHDVISGFSKVMSGSLAPRVLQFEYGQTYLPERRTLHDVYAALDPAGYIVGRIFPKQVEFKSYQLTDEHFRMGNYLAVNREDPLVDVFSRYR